MKRRELFGNSPGRWKTPGSECSAKPADLPVEQPTKFEFVLNAETARSLNLPISTATLLRADEIIE
jgi:hypothetical protein